MSPNIIFYPKAVRASDCVSEGLQLIQPNYWTYVLIGLVAILITACIPCLNYFLVGPIFAGVFYTLLREMRREPVEFGMMFKGFEKFVPAMVVGLIQSIPEIVGNGIRFTGNFADGFSRGMNRGRGNSEYFSQSMQSSSGFPEIALSGGILIFIIIFALAAIVFALAWSITFYFAIPLLAEHDLSIGEAISLSARAGWANWTGLLVLIIFQFLIGIGGVLLLCVGIFFVSPIIYGSKIIAYRQVFPEMNQNFNSEPPRPDQYGGNYGMPNNFGNFQ